MGVDINMGGCRIPPWLSKLARQIGDQYTAVRKHRPDIESLSLKK